jgi:hypothetical protein
MIRSHAQMCKHRASISQLCIFLRRASGAVARPHLVLRGATTPIVTIMAHLSTLPKRIIIIIVSRDFRLSTRCS